jgi:divalent metal cation (Fe/Co/Zn/Cd) transporter
MQQATRDHIGGVRAYELPQELRGTYHRAYRLEWLTVAYLISVGIVMYLAMGSSAAMKAAWVEDVVSIFPAGAFLIASHFYCKPSTTQYPYGYQKAFTVAFVGGSLALLVLGLYVLFDSLMSLVRREHPTIGSINLFGEELWMGWIMLLALFYSFLPAIIIGRKKLPLAEKLHEKVLFVDSQAQKADWLTAAAGMLGIIGVGFGLWWTDGVAAIVISLNIVFDGVSRTRDSMKDLLEELPMTFDNKEIHPVVGKVADLCLSKAWIKDVRIRMREHGMVFFGDVMVTPQSDENLTRNVEQLRDEVLNLDWKIQDIVISPMTSLPKKDT